MGNKVAGVIAVLLVGAAVLYFGWVFVSGIIEILSGSNAVWFLLMVVGLIGFIVWGQWDSQKHSRNR